MAGDVTGQINSATNIKYGVEHNTTGKQFASLNLNQEVLEETAPSYAGDPKRYMIVVIF